MSAGDRPGEPEDALMRAIYRQLDEHLADGEEPYDAAAGLARLMAWIAAQNALPEGYPEGTAPLTHYFHCWRFLSHHPCAVTLIERQSLDIDRQLVRDGQLERALLDLAAVHGARIEEDHQPPHPALPWKVTTAGGRTWHASSPDMAVAKLIECLGLKEVSQVPPGEPRTGQDPP